MINRHLALNKDVEVLAGLGLKEISLAIFLLSLYIFLISFMQIEIDSPLAMMIFSSFISLWILYRSTKLDLSEKQFLSKYLSYFFSSQSVFPFTNKEVRYSCHYLLKSLINYSAISETELNQINAMIAKLLEELLEFRKAATEIKFRIKIQADSRLGIKVSHEAGENAEIGVPLHAQFHPQRSLYIELTSKSEKRIKDLETQLILFLARHKIEYEKLEDKPEKQSYKERSDYIKTREYIKCLNLRDINLDTANHESLNNFLKSLNSKSELCISLKELNLNKSLRKIKFKIDLLESFSKISLNNKPHLEALRQLYSENYQRKFATDLQIYLKLYAKTRDELDKALLNLATRMDFINFNENKFLQKAAYEEKAENPFFMSSTDLLKINPFLEDSSCMKSGALIGYKLDDKSIVHFNPEDFYYCNNKSVNFIGDSGSGKSLAVKLLLKRDFNPLAKFIILDSTLLGWEFFCRYLNADIFNFNEDKKQSIKLFQEKISLINFYNIEKNQSLCNFHLEEIFKQIEYAAQHENFTIYLIIDEAWKLIYEEENPLSKKLISRLARTGRAMNIGLWTISQKPSDLTRDIHSSAASSFIFQCKENEDKRELSSHLNLNEREIQLLESHEIKDRGTALLKTSKFSALIKFDTKAEELILFSSNAELVKQREIIFKEELATIRGAELRLSEKAKKEADQEAALRTIKRIWRKMN